MGCRRSLVFLLSLILLHLQAASASGTRLAAELETLTGVFEVVCEDSASLQASSQFAVILTSEGREVLLSGGGDLREHVQPGTWVRLQGRWLDADASRFGVETVQPLPQQRRTTVQKPQVDHQVLVLVLESEDASVPNPGHGELFETLFNPSTASVAAFYREASYERLTLTGRIHSVDAAGIPTSCNVVEMARAAIAYVDPCIDFNVDYFSIFLIGDFPDECGWTARAGGVLFDSQDRPEPHYARLAAIESWAARNAFVAAHELGHNLGLDHGYLMNCGMVSFAPPCPVNVYQDPYTVMGRPILSHFNAPQKQHLGWFSAQNLAPVETSGSFCLQAMETNDPTALKALEIPLGPDAPYTSLYLEYRQPLGFDAELVRIGPDVYEGLLLHTVSQPGYPRTFLIDATPPTNYFTPALRDYFFEPGTFTYIRTVSTTPESAHLEIVLREDFVRIVQPRSGAVVPQSFEIAAEVHDPRVVHSVEFLLDGFETPVARLEQPPYAVLLSLADSAPGTHTLRARVCTRNTMAREICGVSEPVEFAVDSVATLLETGRESRDHARLELIVPNPFRRGEPLSIVVPRHMIEQRSDVDLRVFDITGRSRATIHDGPLASGRHRFDWEAVDAEGERLPSGIYFAVVRAGPQQRTRKLVLLD